MSVTRLEGVIKEYKISDSAFNIDPNKAVKKTAKALSICRVPVDSGASSESYLMALAAGDYVGSLRNRVNLDDEHEINQASFILLSTVTESFGVGTDWNINYEISAPWLQVARIRDYVLRYYNPETSDGLVKRMESWDSDSLLNQVRDRLGISDRKSEKPYNVLVLSRSWQDLSRDLSFSGITITEDNTKFVVVGSDGRSLEHEYIHTQGSFSFGAKRLFFRGFNEACVESFTPNPRTYMSQRGVLEILLWFVPSLNDLLVEAYKGNPDERRMLFSTLIDQFGLEGFFQIARVHPFKTEEESIFLDPYDVIGYLNRNWRGWRERTQIVLKPAQPSIKISDQEFVPSF